VLGNYSSNIVIVIATVTVGAGPTQIGISGGYAYVTNRLGTSLSVISTTTNTVTSTITGLGAPDAIAFVVPAG
jgi:YVTN family beta-propeller protein